MGEYEDRHLAELERRVTALEKLVDQLQRRHHSTSPTSWITWRRRN